MATGLLAQPREHWERLWVGGVLFQSHAPCNFASSLPSTCLTKMRSNRTEGEPKLVDQKFYLLQVKNTNLLKGFCPIFPKSRKAPYPLCSLRPVFSTCVLLVAVL